MSMRLQVLMPDQELLDIQRIAKREHLTVGEWVRRTLREARAAKPGRDIETKLKAVRRAAQCSYPSPGIKQMLREIEHGYQG